MRRKNSCSVMDSPFTVVNLSLKITIDKRSNPVKPKQLQYYASLNIIHASPHGGGGYYTAHAYIFRENAPLSYVKAKIKARYRGILSP